MQPKNSAPIQQPMVMKDGFVWDIWARWFQKVSRVLFGQEPMPLVKYTVATVPDATQHEGFIIYVSDESGGSVIAFSDGTNWRRTTDRNIIS